MGKEKENLLKNLSSRGRELGKKIWVLRSLCLNFNFPIPIQVWALLEFYWPLPSPACSNDYGNAGRRIVIFVFMELVGSSDPLKFK